MADPNVRPEHVEAWREQTTRSFELRLLPGGHFLPAEAPEAVAREIVAFARSQRIV
jgi:surfactin synthase thioesterase subunit